MAATGQAPYRMEVVRAAHTYKLMWFFCRQNFSFNCAFFPLILKYVGRYILEILEQ